jgi:hypothetical protein
MAKKKIWYMGIDQYGNHYDGLLRPRKDLLNRLYRKHAEKMYIDKIDGTVKHVGYIIAGLWISLYEVTPFEKSV